MQEPIHLARELARIARDNQLAEIDYRNETTRVRLVFEKEHPVVVAAPVAVAEAPVAPTAPAEEPKAPAVTGKTVVSPLAGVFYRAPRPGAPPFVEAGASVGTGDTLCIVEAMKLMNEITADQPLRILRILVENATVVEGGQPLFEYEALG